MSPQSPLRPILPSKAPFCPPLSMTAHSKVSPTFLLHIASLAGYSIHTMTPIGTKVLMAVSPPGSIQIALASSRPTDPIASPGLSTQMPVGTQIILFKTKIIFLHQLFLFPPYLSQERNHRLSNCSSSPATLRSHLHYSICLLTGFPTYFYTPARVSLQNKTEYGIILLNILHWLPPFLRLSKLLNIARVS